jgi:RNA polymerase sigma factor (sigma-70 family)
MRTIYKRTQDELLSAVIGFLKELYEKFDYKSTVIFSELQIQETAKKYHIQGRIHRIIVRHEFVVSSDRRYTKRFPEFPNTEEILSYIEEAKELRNIEFLRSFNKLTKAEKHKYYANRYLRNKERWSVEDVKRLNKLTYQYKLKKFATFTKEEIHEFYKKEYENQRKRKIKKLRVFNEELKKALPKVRNFCKGLDHNHYEDLIQETLLTAWTIKDKYKRGTNISAWLIGIAINKNLNELKRRTNSKEVLVADYYSESIFRESFDYFEPELLHIIEQREKDKNKREQIIINCLNSLPENFRRYITLFSEGKTHREISEEMNVTPNYSKTRLYMARNLLAKEIKKRLKIDIRSVNGTEKG